MATPLPDVKMIPVDADLLESVGYVEPSRQFFVKFRNGPTLCLNNVPGFRYTGLLAAPRKDAYFKTFIKDRFLTKEVAPPTAM
jgi:KTSC domain